MKEDHRQQTWLDETLKLLPRDRVVVARRSRNREKEREREGRGYREFDRRRRTMIYGRE